jgi:hypothetical protein
MQMNQACCPAITHAITQQCIKICRKIQHLKVINFNCCLRQRSSLYILHYDYDDGEIGGMMIGRGNRSTWRKLAPMPLCPPQPPYAARTQTQAAVVGNQ